jgi:hypothetical protein
MAIERLHVRKEEDKDKEGIKNFDMLLDGNPSEVGSVCATYK